MFYAKNKDLELSALIVHNAIYMHFQKVGRIIRTFNWTKFIFKNCFNFNNVPKFVLYIVN